MNQIPRKRSRQLEFLRTGRQKAIIVGGVPVPAGASAPAKVDSFLSRYPWDEIDGQSVLMRALPRARFRGTFGDEVRLPNGTAERLEDFEAGLRDAGLLAESEILKKSHSPFLHFRVQKRQVAVDGTLIHANASVERDPRPELVGVAKRAEHARAPTVNTLCKMRRRPAL